MCRLKTEVVVIHSLSRVRLCATPWTAAYQASLSITNSLNLLKLMSIESVMPFNNLILGVFSKESVLPIRWPKYWSFSFSIRPPNEYLGLISCRIDWFDQIFWRKKWQPTPVLLTGKSHGWRILVGYSPWGRKESDTTERLNDQIDEGVKIVKRLSLWTSG